MQFERLNVAVMLAWALGVGGPPFASTSFPTERARLIR
jgi:hypothetical protein